MTQLQTSKGYRSSHVPSVFLTIPLKPLKVHDILTLYLQLNSPRQGQILCNYMPILRISRDLQLFSSKA